jgi:hypothetical protein
MREKGGEMQNFGIGKIRAISFFCSATRTMIVDAVNTRKQ